MRAMPEPTVILSWSKTAPGWWKARHKGRSIEICAEKLTMHPEAFVIFVDGQRMGTSAPTLGAAQARAENLVD